MEMVLDMMVEVEIVKEERLDRMPGMAADEAGGGDPRRRRVLAEAADAAAEQAEGCGAGRIEGQHPPQSAAGGDDDRDHSLHDGKPDQMMTPIAPAQRAIGAQPVELDEAVSGERIEEVPEQSPAARRSRPR